MNKTTHFPCGVCTTDYTPRSAKQLFDDIAEDGFECVQFSFASIGECDFEPDGLIEIPEKIPQAALDTVSTACEKSELPIIAVNGTFNMAHPDDAVRAEGLRRFALLAPAASFLGAKYISLCSGTANAENLWAYAIDNSSPAAWKRMADTMKCAVEIAEKNSITLAIETEAANVISTPEAARRIMDEIGSENLKMILDAANLFHEGKAHKSNVRETLSHAFELFGKDIVIAHGKDIRDGDGIEFCGTGEGIVDFAYLAHLLREYGFGGAMFLHGIYDENKMTDALRHWKKAEADASGIVI